MKQLIIIGLALIALITNAQFPGQKFKAGDNAPDFKTKDITGKQVQLAQLLETHKSVVLIFYRGEWCRYCRKHLSALQDSLQFIYEKDAAVVVVTPSQPDYVKEMMEKTGAEYTFISDNDYRIMDDYGVSYKISKETVPKYYPFVLNKARKSNGNENDVLPIPATFVIGKNKKISYIHFDPDYTKRSSIRVILQYI